MGDGEEGLSISVVLGYNASKWLAFALNRGKIRGYHERLYGLTRLGKWPRTFAYLLRNPVDSPPMQRYWDAVREDINNNYDVIDTNIWPAYLVPDVNDYFPLKHILYVTRNGIRWVYSVLASSGFKNWGLKRFELNTYLKTYWDKMGQPRKPWNKWNKFERICLYWSTSYYMANWLEEQGLTIHRFRMEDLTGTKKIHELFGLFGLKVARREARRIQSNDINSHTRNISARKVWNSWTGIQRTQFKEICKEGMDYYDYEIF